MRQLTRVLSAALAASVATVVVAAAPASADATPAGLSSTQTKTSVLSLQVGDLLNVGLLTDTGGANIDPNSGTLQSLASLVPITLESPALHLNLSTPAIVSAQPNGNANALGQALTLQGLGVPALLATADIKPASLTTAFSSLAAHASMTAAEIDNLTLLGGGLASINLLSSNLGAAALSAQGNGTRGIQLGEIKLLDLGALLSGIGGNLAALPVSILSTLAGQLGVPVPNDTQGSSTTLAGQVGELSNAITALRTAVVNTTTQLTTPIDSLTSTLLGALNLPIPGVGTPVATLVTDVNNLVGSLQTTLVNLLTGVLSKLDSFPLIDIAATNLGINTLAADTVGASSAGVTVSPLQITVAGVKLPAIDTGALLNTVNGVLGTANGALNGILSTLGLPQNLISLNILGQMHDVTQNAGYVDATAGVSLLSLKIADLSQSVVGSALGSLTGTSASSLLGGLSLGSILPASTSMGGIGSLLGSLAPLLSGINLSVASIAGESTFVQPAAVAPPVQVNPPTVAPPAIVQTQLPHTGGDPELAIIGMILAGLGLAAVRWNRISRAQAAARASS